MSELDNASFIQQEIDPQSSSFFDLINYDTQSEISISDPKTQPDTQRSDFIVDLDLALAIPLVFYSNSKEKKNQKVATASVMRSHIEGGRFKIVNVKTFSPHGPMKGFDMDVLTVFGAMIFEKQSGLSNYGEEESILNEAHSNGSNRVVFNVADICEKLKLDIGCSTRIQKSIKKIRDQRVVVETVTYCPEKSKKVEHSRDFNFFSATGKISISDIKSGKERGNFYVEIDPFIVDNLLKRISCNINQKEFFLLNCGPERRILMFLNAKRAVLGDSFYFFPKELMEVFGIGEDEKDRLARAILKPLMETSQKVGSFEVKVISKSNNHREKISMDNHVINIVFKEKIISLDEDIDPFIAKIVNYYGHQCLKGLSLTSYSLSRIKADLMKQYLEIKKNTPAFIKFKDRSINITEFVIDVTLYQHKFCNYIVKNFAGLTKKIMSEIVVGGFVIPEDYTMFLNERIDHEEKVTNRESAQKFIEDESRKKEEESLRIRNMFLEYYDKLTKNTKTNEALEAKARESILKRKRESGEAVEFDALELMSEKILIAETEFNSGEFRAPATGSFH